MLHTLRTPAHTTADDVLRDMFAARKSVFVDLLKWDVPIINGTYEIDQFDNEHACYLVLAEPGGAHLGSARLLPTNRPHILGTLYPGLCEGPPPSGETIVEITRFCLDRRLRAAERRAVRDTLVTAIVDHALTHRISHYTAIAEFGWFQQILAFGWRCRPLGLPQTVDGSLLAALEISITPDTPAMLARAGVLPRQALLGAELAAA